MPERMTRDEVVRVANLSMLELSDDEIDTMTDQLGAMLDHFADIDSLDLSAIEPMAQPLPLVNVLRDDVVGATLDRDEVLAAAPSVEDGRFRVPPMTNSATTGAQ